MGVHKPEVGEDLINPHSGTILITASGILS